jgi:acetylornithine/N-succinyldiaminopimelate aminotransferase
VGDNQKIAEQASRVLIGNYRPQPIALVRGEGCWLYDADGRRYLDLMAGIATTVLGHCHPRVVAALEAQAKALWHVSNLYYTEPQTVLAELLTAHSFADRAFFCNSGAEANEAALKLARRWHRVRGDDRFEIVAFEGGFHGRTLFTVSVTGTPAYWQGFEPLVEGVRFAPFGDLDAVKAQLSSRTAAIIVEPVQGEGGVRVAPPGFLSGLRELSNECGCLLIFDEVQSGLGRTGSLFAYEEHGVTPDLMTLAKALGNGIPIGAMLCREELAGALVPGTHGSTLGGNPLACACGVAVVSELVESGLLAHAREVGTYLAKELRDLAARLGPDRVVEARGVGLLHALELPGPSAEIIQRCREKGVLVIAAGPKVIRFAPPLIIERDQIDEGLAVVEEVLAST